MQLLAAVRARAGPEEAVGRVAQDTEAGLGQIVLAELDAVTDLQSAAGGRPQVDADLGVGSRIGSVRSAAWP